MKCRLVFGIPVVVLGLLIAAGPVTVFPVCPVMMEMIMRCHWTAQAELGVGIIIAILGLLSVLIESQQVRLGLSIAIFLNGIFALLIPSVLIGVCPGAHMHCRTLSLPALVILGGITVAVAGFKTVRLWKKA
jgi:hypothetical protein